MLIEKRVCVILRRINKVSLKPRKMKRAIILLVFILSQTIAFGQVKEISAGITPYGHWRIREGKSKEDLLSHTYSMSKPAFQFGLGFRSGFTESLVELYYAKEDPTLTVNIDTNPISFNYGTNHHVALRGYMGFTILNGARVQIPIYLGIGLSYHSQPVPTKLFLDFGGRVRMRIYITNRIALYAGGYYLVGLFGNKDNHKSAYHSGLEAGLMFNF